MRECHDVPSVGHVGMRRTLELVARQYHWRGMQGDIADYVRTYRVCQEVKSDNRTKPGLLQPLEISTRKWAQVTTDLVTDLLESNGFTTIAVFVDRMTKMVYFASCTKEVTALEYARIFVDTVFRLHGLLEVIISDQDPRFTSKFQTSLFDLLGTNLRCGNFGSVAWGCHWALAGQAQYLVPTGQCWSGPVLWPMGGLTSVYQ